MDKGATDELGRLITSLVKLLLPAPKGVGELSPNAHASLRLALVHLSDVIAKELDAVPMSDARLRELLCGRPGATTIGPILAEQAILAGLSQQE
jgi:hypothetical protein